MKLRERRNKQNIKGNQKIESIFWLSGKRNMQRQIKKGINKNCI